MEDLRAVVTNFPKRGKLEEAVRRFLDPDLHATIPAFDPTIRHGEASENCGDESEDDGEN